MKTFAVAAMILTSYVCGYLMAGDGVVRGGNQDEVESPWQTGAERQPTAMAAAGCMTERGADSAAPDMKPGPQLARGLPALQRTASPDVATGSAGQSIDLASYTEQVQQQLPPATALVLKVHEDDFRQMLQEHRQDGQRSDDSWQFQQQLSDFFSQHPAALTLSNLHCSSRYCELELTSMDTTRWPTLFAALSQQSWWQAVSYQSESEQSHHANGLHLLLQLPVAAEPQVSWQPDDGQF